MTSNYTHMPILLLLLTITLLSRTGHVFSAYDGHTILCNVTSARTDCSRAGLGRSQLCSNVSLLHTFW